MKRSRQTHASVDTVASVINDNDTDASVASYDSRKKKRRVDDSAEHDDAASSVVATTDNMDTIMDTEDDLGQENDSKIVALDMSYVRSKLEQGSEMVENGFHAFKKLVYDTLEREGARKSSDRRNKGLSYLMSQLSRSGSAGSSQSRYDGDDENKPWHIFLSSTQDEQLQSVEQLDAFCLKMAKNLIDAERFKSFFAMFDFMYEVLQLPFTVMHYNMMIDTHLRQGFFRGAKKILQDMIQAGCMPNVQTFNHFILANIRFDKVEMAEDVLEEMKAEGIQPDVSSYNLLLGGYAKRAIGEGAKSCLKVLDQMRKAGVKPDVESYRVMIDGLLHAKDAKSARQQYIAMMKDVGSNPSTAIPESLYNTLITWFAKKGKIDQAEKYLNDLEARTDISPARTIQPYQVLADAHIDKNNTNSAEELLDRAYTKFQLRPDQPEIYNKLIVGYIHERRPERAHNALKTMKELGLRPSSRIASDLVLSFVSLNKHEEASAMAELLQTDFELELKRDATKELTSRAVFEDVRFDPSDETTLLQALQKLQTTCPVTTFSLVKHMILTGQVRASVLEDSYLPSLFHALRRRGKYEQMGQLLIEVLLPRSAALVEPFFFDKLFSAMFKAGISALDDMIRWFVCLETLAASGKVNREQLFAAVKWILRLFSNHHAQIPVDQVNKHLDFLKRVLQSVTNANSKVFLSSNIRVFEDIVACCFVANELELGVRLIKSTTKLFGQERLQARIFSPLIRRYMHVELDAKKAEDLLMYAQKLSIPLDQNIFSELLDGHLHMGQLEQASEVLDRMKRINQQLTESMFLQLITRHAQDYNTTGMQSVIAKMQAEGFVPDLHAYWHLLEQYLADDKKKDKAKALLDSLRDEGISVSTTSFNFLQRELSPQKGRIHSVMPKLLAVLEIEGIKPNVFVLNTLLHLCFDSSEMEKVLKTMKTAHATEASPTHYALIFRQLLKEGKVEKAIVVLRDHVSTNTLLFKDMADVLLEHVFEVQQKDSMPDTLQFLAQNFSGLNICIPTSVVVALADHGNVKQAVAVMSQMHEKFGMTVNHIMTNAILRAMLRQGDKSQQIDAFLADSQTKFGVLVSSATYQSLVHQCVQLERFDEADCFLQRYIEEQSSSGLHNDEVQLFEMVISALASRNQCQRAQQLFDTLCSFTRPTVRIVNHLFEAYAREGNMQQLDMLVARMRRFGLQPDADTFSSLVSLASNKQFYDLASKMESRLNNAGLRQTIK